MREGPYGNWKDIPWNEHTEVMYCNTCLKKKETEYRTQNGLSEKGRLPTAKRKELMDELEKGYGGPGTWHQTVQVECTCPRFNPFARGAVADDEEIAKPKEPVSEILWDERYLKDLDGVAGLDYDSALNSDDDDQEFEGEGGEEMKQDTAYDEQDTGLSGPRTIQDDVYGEQLEGPSGTSETKGSVEMGMIAPTDSTTPAEL